MTLEEALERDLPPTDQGHPQTDLTRRVADIMATVCAMLFFDGLKYEAYNFHETPDAVRFNTRHYDGFGKPDDDGGFWVGMGAVGRETLRHATDASIITSQYEQIKNPPKFLTKAE